MGIERFFNTLKDEYKTSFKEIKNEDNLFRYNITKLYIDFNSIVHIISQRVIKLINKSLEYSLCSVNGLDCGNYIDILESININLNLDVSNEDDIYEKYNDFFNKEMLDTIITNHTINYTLNLFSKFNNLELIYIAIDGVPTKAKIVEQKKRRFMGEFIKHSHNYILEKHEEILNVEYNIQNNIPFNKYKFMKNKISWNKANISPATSFMKKLSNELNNVDFLLKVNELFPKINREKLIISDFNQYGEGEKKIIDYININERKYTNICIYSPDSDMILLSMLIRKDLKKYVLRLNQQKSEDFNQIVDSISDLSDINDFENKLYSFIKTKKNKFNIINDIVFIMTMFGDDFLPKIEYIDVRNDIEYILNLYSNYIKTNNFILNYNNEITINFDNFINFIKMFDENYLIKKYQLTKKYHNYYKLINKINNVLKKNKYSYDNVNAFNIESFIEQHNILLKPYIVELFNDINYDIRYITSNSIDLLSYYKTIKNKYNKYNKYINTIKKILINPNNDIFYYILDSYTKNINPFIYIPLFNYTLKLQQYDYTTSSFRHQNKYDILINDYEKDIYKFDNMLDEYKNILNNNDSSLSNTLQSNDLSYAYFDGLQWLVDYYYNDIIYDKWFYPFDKAPKFSDLINYIQIYDINNSKENLKKLKFSNNDRLIPLEQLLYITPIEPNILTETILHNYPNLLKQKIINFINNLPYKNILIPNFQNITQRIFTGEKNLISCNNALFLNKCILNVVNNSNLIDEEQFKDEFRKIITVEDEINILKGGYDNNKIKKKLKMLKQQYYLTGGLVYKNSYKRIKKLLN